MDDERPVAGYYRVSQARDAMRAPELYRNEIERYCRYRGLELKEVFSDIDYSGYRGSERRPALQELVRRRGEFCSIIVPKLSRFGRSLKHLTQLFETFDCDGISLVFLDIGLDTSTSQGRLLRNVMAAFAEYESDVKSDYSRANHRQLAASGRPVGTSCIYGYRYDKVHKNYEPVPEQTTIVGEIYRRYLSGASLGGIARELNRREVRTARGKAWTHKVVAGVLDNPVYAGCAATEVSSLVPAA
jgi:site-specific DNA recombinase